MSENESPPGAPEPHAIPKFLFLKVETTGNDPETCSILQISATVTDAAFEPIASRTRTCWVLPIEGPAGTLHFEFAALEAHTRSGLLARYSDAVDGYDETAPPDGTVSLGIAETDIWSLIGRDGPERLILAGPNVEAFERRFLRKYMPSLDERLHFRVLDTNALREVLASAAGHDTRFPSVGIANAEVDEAISVARTVRARCRCEAAQAPLDG